METLASARPNCRRGMPALEESSTICLDRTSKFTFLDAVVGISLQDVTGKRKYDCGVPECRRGPNPTRSGVLAGRYVRYPPHSTPLLPPRRGHFHYGSRPFAVGLHE